MNDIECWLSGGDMEQKKKRKAWNKKEPSCYEQLLKKSDNKRIKRFLKTNKKDREWI